MRLSRLAFGALLLSSPILSHAQTAEPASVPKFYVGLAAYSSYYQRLGRQFQGTAGFPVPVQLTAGYQLRPRTALQLGVAYSGSSFSYNDEGYAYASVGTAMPYYYRYTGNSKLRVTSVSALARHTLTLKPNHRMQFDAMAGLGLEHGSNSYSNTRVDSTASGLQTSNDNQHSSGNLLLVTAGIGTRYRLGPRLALTFDFTLNYNVPIQGESDPAVTSAAALGLRYRFGQH